MKRTAPAESPDAYVESLSGWRMTTVASLRKCTLAVGGLEERIKWGHLVYFSNGPVLLIRAEDERVLFGFWRGKRLRDVDDRLKTGGKYEMATIALLKAETISPAQIKRLVKFAVVLNAEFGDPTTVSKVRSTRPNNSLERSRDR